MRFCHEGLDLFNRYRAGIILALNNDEVVIQALFEADDDIKLATVDFLVPEHIRALLRHFMDRGYQALEMFPFWRGHIGNISEGQPSMAFVT